MRLKRVKLTPKWGTSPHQLGRPRSEGLNPPAEPHGARQSVARFKFEPEIHANPELVEQWEELETRSRFQRLWSWLVDRAI